MDNWVLNKAGDKYINLNNITSIEKGSLTVEDGLGHFKLNYLIVFKTSDREIIWEYSGDKSERDKKFDSLLNSIMC